MSNLWFVLYLVLALLTLVMAGPYACNQADPYIAPSVPNEMSEQDEGEQDIDALNDLNDMSMESHSTSSDMMVDEEEYRLAQQVAFIEAQLVPRKPLYTRNEQAEIVLTCYDRYGEEIPAPALHYTVRPDEIATWNDPMLTFTQEGQGALRICVDLNRSVCGRVSFYVDDEAPSITLSKPQPFEIIRGEQTHLEIEGQVNGQEYLYINEIEIETDEQGYFTHQIPLHFGYNTVEATAFDGVRTPATRVIRSVLYAPAELSMDVERLQWSDALTINIAPRALSDIEGVGLVNDPMMNPLVFTDLSSSLAHLLQQINPLDLVDPILSEDDDFQLSLLDVDMGTPFIQIIPQVDRLEVFLRFANMRADLSGFFRFEGIELDLTGTVRIDMSAFSALQVQVIQGDLEVEVAEVGIALEDLSATMEDATAQALMDTLTSTIRLTVAQWSESFIQNLADQAIPNLITQQTLAGLTTLNAFGFVIDQPGLSVSTRTDIATQLSQVEVSEALGMLARFQAELPRQNTGENALLPAYQQAIIPTHTRQDIPWKDQRHVSIALPLSILNALLYDLWQQELLNLTLSDKIPSFLAPLIGKAELKSVLPPLIVDTPLGSQAPLALSLEGLYLDVWNADLSSKDRYRVSLYAALGLMVEKPSIPMMMNEEVNDGKLQFTLPLGAVIRITLEEQGSDLVVVDPVLIETSIAQFLLPEINKLIEEGLQIDYPIFQVDLLDIISDDDLSEGVSSRRSNLWLLPQFEDLLQVENGWLIFNTRLDSVFTFYE